MFARGLIHFSDPVVEQISVATVCAAKLVIFTPNMQAGSAGGAGEGK